MKYILLNTFNYKNKKNDADMVCLEIYDHNAKQTFRVFKPLDKLDFGKSGESPKKEQCPLIVECDLHLSSYVNQEGKQVYSPDISTLSVVKPLALDKI